MHLVTFHPRCDLTELIKTNNTQWERLFLCVRIAARHTFSRECDTSKIRASIHHVFFPFCFGSAKVALKHFSGWTMKKNYHRNASGFKPKRLSGTQSVKHGWFICGGNKCLLVGWNMGEKMTRVSYSLIFLLLFDHMWQLCELMPGCSCGSDKNFLLHRRQTYRKNSRHFNASKWRWVAFFNACMFAKYLIDET